MNDIGLTLPYAPVAGRMPGTDVTVTPSESLNATAMAAAFVVGVPGSHTAVGVVRSAVRTSDSALPFAAVVGKLIRPA